VSTRTVTVIADTIVPVVTVTNNVGGTVTFTVSDVGTGVASVEWFTGTTAGATGTGTAVDISGGTAGLQITGSGDITIHAVDNRANVANTTVTL
jgi:hypothetical protein